MFRLLVMPLKDYVTTSDYNHISGRQGTVEVNGRRLPLAIAGDAAYPLQTWLMKAYLTAQQRDPTKKLFNRPVPPCTSTGSCPVSRALHGAGNPYG